MIDSMDLRTEQKERSGETAVFFHGGQELFTNGWWWTVLEATDKTAVLSLKAGEGVNIEHGVLQGFYIYRKR